MSVAAKMASAPFAPSALSASTGASQQASTTTESSNGEIDKLFPRCVTSPKTSEAPSAIGAPATGKKKTKKKKASNGAIKTKKKSKSNNIDQQKTSSEKATTQTSQAESCSPSSGAAATKSKASSATTATVATAAAAPLAPVVPATGALADILDLDFGAVVQKEIQLENRQYILDNPSAEKYSTREPLRPSVTSTAAVVTADTIEKSKNTLRSSNSSISSNSSGSRKLQQTSNLTCTVSAASSAVLASAEASSSSSVVAVTNTTSKSALDSSSGCSPPGTLNSTPLNSSSNNSSSSSNTATGANSSSVLRDTKIEIAGGREVYSQSKARSGRHKNRRPQPPKEVTTQPQPDLQEVIPSPQASSNSYQPAPAACKVLKETVFSSEIHSIEYNSPLASMSSGSSSADSPKIMLASNSGQSKSTHNRAKNINVDTGVVVFDDIKDCDVNVTYDLIDGEFPPPNISGLVVRDPNDLLTSDDLHHGGNDCDLFDPEADRRSEASSGGASKIIGDITIAEYEGSPRRYRPRPSPPQVRPNESKQKQPQRPPLRLPGFPQRVLPPQENSQETSPEKVDMDKTEAKVASSVSSGGEEELLKFEDGQPTLLGQSSSSVQPQLVTNSQAVKDNNKEYESKMRYEFSETRKVLDEFFHKAEEAAEATTDLNYVLRKNNNYVVGQRLASELDENDKEPTETVLDQDLLLTSPTPVKEPPNSLNVLGVGSKGPILGVSPLDQPLVNFGMSLKAENELRNNEADSHQPQSTMGQNAIVQPQSNNNKVNGNALQMQHRPSGPVTVATNQQDLDSRNFTLSPETTDCDSADLESEMSVNEGSFHSSGPRMHTAMPVLEDGLSSGHASDLEDDIIYSSSGSVVLKKQHLLAQHQQYQQSQQLQQHHHQHHHSSQHNHGQKMANKMAKHHELLDSSHTPTKFSADNSAISSVVTSPTSSVRSKRQQPGTRAVLAGSCMQQPPSSSSQSSGSGSVSIGSTSSGSSASQEEPKGPSIVRNNGLSNNSRVTAAGTYNPAGTNSDLDPLTKGPDEVSVPTCQSDESVAAALKDIKMAIQATRVLQHQTRIPSSSGGSNNTASAATTLDNSTVLQTQPLQQQQQSPPSENGISEDPWIKRPSQSTLGQSLSVQSVSCHQDMIPSSVASAVLNLPSAPANIILAGTPNVQELEADKPPIPEVEDLDEDEDEEDDEEEDEEEEDDEEEEEEDDEEEEEEEEESESSEIAEERVPTPKNVKDDEDLDTDQETDRLLGQQYNDDNGYYDQKNEAAKKKGTTKTKEAVTDPKVLIEGVLFRARYLGSTQLVCDGQPTKATRMMQAEEAVSRIKALAPDGESQPSTEVDLFISTEKIMVLNTDLKEIMMDHSLRSISYIADIGDLLVIMARRRIMPQDGEELQVIGSTPKMICHVFESEEAQFIAQSIGQAFQVAYVEFLKANGIEDHSFVKEMDYQEVLNSQEIFGNELALFAKKELQKEVVVPKAKGEILGVVIVESGWGSMLPTIVLANLLPTGPAARCGQLNIGDQVIAINGISLVGLPLSTCQTYIKNTKNKTAVKLTAVSCAPVVEVKIKRPDTKYQLGFSVQNGVICSLLRGGIAERGGVRVGHRIIEINGQSVVAVPHEKIVNLLATSVGEITMKTMPTSMFRLLTGQETPLYI